MPEKIAYNSPIRGVEAFTRVCPRYPELVDLWANYLEFWDRNGGLDNVTPEEIEQAHEVIIKRAEEVLVDYPGDVANAGAHSNLAQHAAQEIRRHSLEFGEA
ncbi:hypothetical protein HY379_02515 [Candidatus Saccharibacteria bacterium]|nr:hypothetical protein [Candidatus Saccharibacteria bacterium]